MPPAVNFLPDLQTLNSIHKTVSHSRAKIHIIEKLNESVEQLASKLAKSSPKAMEELKKVLWEGTDHWDKLLEKRAEISGELVLSDYTHNFIEEFKSK